MKRLLKLATKHTVIFSIGDIAQKAVGFVLLPIYMRCLSPDDYGVLAMLGILAMVFTGLVLQGMPTASFRAYSFDYGKVEKDQKDVISSAYTYLLIISFLVYLFLFLIAPVWSNILFKEGDFTKFIRIVFITEFFNCSSSIPYVILRARLLSAWMAGISLFRVFITTILTIWFVVYRQMGVEGVLLANMIVAGIAFFLSPLITFIVHRGFSLHISFDKLKGMLAFGWPIVPGIFAAWIMSSADRYFLEHLSTREELGLYSVGFKLATILIIGFIAPFRKTWPAIFYPKAKDGDAQEVFSKFATYFLLAGTIGSLGIICAADHLIKIMGPREYWDAYTVVPILVIGLLVHGFQGTINLGIFIQNKTKYAPVIVIIGAISNILFNILLIPRYGMMGAATGTMLSYIVMLVFTYMINQRIYPIKYDYKRLLHMTVIFVLIVAANYMIKIDSFWWSLLVKSILFVSFPILLFVTKFFTKSELEVVNAFNQKILSVTFKSAQ